MTTILLAALCLALIFVLWLNQRTHSRDLSNTNTLIEKLLSTSAEERRDWVTKALQRAERSSDKGMASLQKTAESLCRTFQLQMTAVQAPAPEQQSLALEWDGSLHPAEIQELSEEKRMAALQARIDPRLMGDPMMNPDSGWSVPKKVQGDLEDHRANGGQPEPPGMRLPDLSYDPSPS